RAGGHPTPEPDRDAMANTPRTRVLALPLNGKGLAEEFDDRWDSRSRTRNNNRAAESPSSGAEPSALGVSKGDADQSAGQSQSTTARAGPPAASLPSFYLTSRLAVAAFIVRWSPPRPAPARAALRRRGGPGSAANAIPYPPRPCGRHR